MNYHLSGLLCIFLISGTVTFAQIPVPEDSVTGDTVFTSRLPVIRIDTRKKAIGDSRRIPAFMKIEQLHPGRLVLFEGSINIEIRGSSSKKFPKKSYSFSLIDTSGKKSEATLLGLPKESDWILYAPYSDKTLLRDVIAYKISRDLGRYATRTVFVEMFLNNKYQGVYILEEKIKQGLLRVNAGTADPDKKTTLEKGYILRIDRPGDGKRYLKPGRFSRYVGDQSTPDKKSKEESPTVVRQPKKCDVEGESYFESSYKPKGSSWQSVDFHFYDPPAESLSTHQKMNLCSIMYNVESSFVDPFPMSKDSGYHKLIDLKSFIDYFIISEVTRNIDAYRLSTYFFITPDIRGRKMIMGPVWDFNLSMGNADYCDGYMTSGWTYEYNYTCSKDPWLVPFWWERLIDDPVFRGELKCRWLSLRKNKLSTEELMNFIDEQVALLHDAPHRNFRRWPVLGKDIWPNKYVFKSYLEEIAFLKKWLTERLDWLDRNMPGDCTGISSGMSQ